MIATTQDDNNILTKNPSSKPTLSIKYNPIKSPATPRFNYPTWKPTIRNKLGLPVLYSSQFA